MGAGGSRYVIPIVNGSSGCGCCGGMGNGAAAAGLGGLGGLGAASFGGGAVGFGNCCDSLQCGTPVVRLGKVNCANLRFC